jgi:hypothetical protein
MQTAGARVLREDDNEMSREAVLLQWERKVEVADSRESGRFVRAPREENPRDAQGPETTAAARGPETTAGEQGPEVNGDEHRALASDGDTAVDVAVPLRPAEDATKPLPRRFERSAERAAAPARPADGQQDAPERRTIRITGQPTRPRRRAPMVEAQLAQPDRIALWAFLLGLILVAIAAGTAHA